MSTFYAPKPEAAQLLLEQGPSYERKVLRAAYGSPAPVSPARRVRYRGPAPPRKAAASPPRAPTADVAKRAFCADEADAMVAKDHGGLPPKKFSLQRGDLEPIVTSMNSTMDGFEEEAGPLDVENSVEFELSALEDLRDLTDGLISGLRNAGKLLVKVKRKELRQKQKAKAKEKEKES